MSGITQTWTLKLDSNTAPSITLGQVTIDIPFTTTAEGDRIRLHADMSGVRGEIANALEDAALRIRNMEDE